MTIKGDLTKCDARRQSFLTRHIGMGGVWFQFMHGGAKQMMIQFSYGGLKKG